MPILSLFTSTSLPTQSNDKAYGVKNADLFRVSSSFEIASETAAYAMIEGTLLLQQQATDPNKVNLILRPHNQKDLKLPVKYIIYRGLKTTDFVASTNLSDTANKVKTSGNELLAKMQTIQTQRAPGTDIPIQALFGNELTPANSKNIDDFFFKNLASSSQLFTIDSGTELGKFAAGEIGVEIILENPEYFVTVDIAKKSNYEIDVSGITDTTQKKWQKDLVRHFVDPAAFYGLHYDIKDGIEYRQGANKPVANTSISVYQNIIDKFSTKNKVYLDIRNENGYSYNYYNNYLGTGSDADKNIKIGQSAALLTTKEYYTSGWAIHSVDSADMISSGNESSFSLALRVNDNKKPLIASWNFLPILQSGSMKSDKNVHFVDENVLITNPSDDYCTAVSFKIPYLPSESEQLATILKQDYMKQPVSTPSSVDFPRSRFTDYLFGTTNLEMPWDSDDKTQWFTDYYRTYINSSDETGFAGITETGQIIETDPTTSENVIFYAAPINYFSNIGMSKLIPLNTKGGLLNIDTIFDLPDVKITKTNLMTSSENVLTLSFPEDEKLKKPLFLLGITKVQWESATTSASSVLSNIHTKLIKLSSASASTDLNGTIYYQHEVILSGLDSTGNYQEVNTGINVYTLDHFIFSSKSFAEKYQIDYTEAQNNLNEFINETLGIYGGSGNGIKLDKLQTSNEEKTNLENGNYWTLYSGGKSNKDLFGLDPTIKDKVTEFKEALDIVQENYAAIEALIQQKGADLLKHAKIRIKGKDPVTGVVITPEPAFKNKDGILYVARLLMQVILKNHPKILTKFPSKIEALSDVFEKHSRGLVGSEQPIFLTPQSSTHFNILISGFDPFAVAMNGGYYDEDGYQSNSSGNLALALDNELLEIDGKEAIIKAVIFPVRYREFNKKRNGTNDEGWVEDFFKPYVIDNNVKMIITFSHGINGKVYSMEIERFAARYRTPIVNDNNLVQGSKSEYLDASNKNDSEFLMTTLPYTNMFIVDEVGLDQKAIFHYYKNEKFVRQGYDPAIDAAQPIAVNDYKFYPKNPNGNDDLTPNILVPEININSYPPPATISANKIKSYKGSGGYYLSNEIFYRVAFLRKTLNSAKMTGHIHLEYLQNSHNMSVNRNHMLETISTSIRNALKHF